MVRLYRTFSNYISSGDTRCAGCNMHQFWEVQPLRSSSNLMYIDFTRVQSGSTGPNLLHLHLFFGFSLSLVPCIIPVLNFTGFSLSLDSSCSLQFSGFSMFAIIRAWILSVLYSCVYSPCSLVDMILPVFYFP